MSAWRAAGLNYINYSNIAARCLRNALKPEFRADAMKRGDSHIRFTKWENGKPIRSCRQVLASPTLPVYPMFPYAWFEEIMKIHLPPPKVQDNPLVDNVIFI